MADLKRYEAKRRQGRTPEPFSGERSGGDDAPIFVVQRHSARRLHYDFRLERGGVLASWALPRGVPLRAGERALAVHVEDHPLDYAGFSGVIPAGEYGAGTVDIWDHGTYELLHERRDGQLTVILHGERLQGEWALIPSHLDGQERNWLIVRAAKQGALGQPSSYAPMRPRVAARIPSAGEWAFELAWQGMRAIAVVEGARARLEHAEGDVPDERLTKLLAQFPRALRTSECVLDGVVCALDESGRPSRELLVRGDGGLVYMAVDLLDLEGRSLVDEPWSARREQLERDVLDERVDDVRLSRAFDDGGALRQLARAQGLGIVAKRRNARYRPGKETDDWRLLEP
jgi:bifunctional non-homologous end joining protein LigD